MFCLLGYFEVQTAESVRLGLCYHQKYQPSSLIDPDWSDLLAGSDTDTQPYLVGDDALIIEDLQHLGLGEGLVPLGDLVGVAQGLYQHLGGHLNFRLTTIDLPTFGVLTTLHDVSLEIKK